MSTRGNLHGKGSWHPVQKSEVHTHTHTYTHKYIHTSMYVHVGGGLYHIHTEVHICVHTLYIYIYNARYVSYLIVC